MTKIFITIPWFLPAFRAGGPVQSIANLVKEYREGVEYFIFCGDVDLNGAALENIETNKWTRFNDHTHVWYAGPEKISDTLVRLVEIEKPDVLFIIGIFSWHYNIVPIMFCKGTRRILSTRGMLHPGALSQKKWKKKIFLHLYKLMEYHYKVAFHATDEGEANYIRNFFGKEASVFIAGNFPNKISFLPVLKKEPGNLKLLTIALISPMKNILLVLEALSKASGNIEYHIYGPIKDEDYWDRCKKIIKSLPGNIKIVYEKEIAPQKIKQALEKAHVFILPSKSENFGHALFEALSAGRPVITSDTTPWTNLKESNAGINVPTGAPGELKDAIDFFASLDQASLESWSLAAHNYSESSVDLERIKKEYGRMFSGVSASQ